MSLCYWPRSFFTSDPAAELSLLLRDLILKLYSEHLSADGKVAPKPPCIHSTLRLRAPRVSSLLPQAVDYKGMSVNPTFERYSELAVQLQRVELLSLSREEKLAFFINIYNALVIHGYLRLGAPTNVFQRYRVWPGPQSCSQMLFKPSFSFLLMGMW